MAIADTLLSMGYTPQGVSPKTSIQGSEPGNYATDPFRNLVREVATFQARNQMEEQKRLEIMKNKASLYQTLRDAGYSPDAAMKAVESGKAFPSGGGDTLEEKQLKSSERTSSIQNRRLDIAEKNLSLSEKRLDNSQQREERLSQPRQVVMYDPITGEARSTAEVPAMAKVYKGALTPETMKERAVAEGEAKAVVKDIEMSNKLAGAVKRLALLNKQFNEAIPSGSNSPIQQRISGGVQSWAAKYGILDNAKLVALQKNIRPIAINMIRLFGEVGNLSETEQQGAIDVVNQAGLTDSERLESTRQFMEYALAGARPESIDLIKGRSDISEILKVFGVDISGGVDVMSDPNLQDKIKAARASGYSDEEIRKYLEAK